MARSYNRALLRYLRPHWQQTALGITALLLVNALGVYIPLLIRNSIDDLQSSFSLDRIVQAAIAIFLLTTIVWVVRMASRIWTFGVGRKVEFDLKQAIFEHLLKMEPAYFATTTIGDTISRATNDVDNVRRLLGFAVLSLANTIFAYALTIPVMIQIDPLLSVLSLGVYPLMLGMVMAFSDRLRREQLWVQEELSTMSDLIQEDLSGIAPIKIYAQEENERRAFRELNNRLLRANLSMAKTRNLLFPLLGGLASVSLLVLLWFGSDAIATGRISIGDFVALTVYVERLVFPTALLGFTISTYQRGQVSVDRVEAILAAEPKITDELATEPLPLDQVRGALRARGLTYCFPGAQTPALNGLDFDILPGEMVAIVGPVGSGKSTLANALPRLLDIEPGQLWLDGRDVTKIPLTDLRRAIAYVPQESFLFSTTIAHNIAYGAPESDRDRIERAAQRGQIHDEIQQFPRQYETLVGERGITLSGGQRQRSSLARALLVDAPILILDDALSSVDNKTATEILRRLTGGDRDRRRTVLFISHQLSAAATADRILVMDRGRIVDVGRHEELRSRPGLYQDLWNQHTLEAVLR